MKKRFSIRTLLVVMVATVLAATGSFAVYASQQQPQPVDLAIKKVDEFGAPLKGAKFKVSKEEGTEWKVILPSGTTDENGVITITSYSLYPDMITLDDKVLIEEIEAPAGFTKAAPVEKTIGELMTPQEQHVEQQQQESQQQEGAEDPEDAVVLEQQQQQLQRITCRVVNKYAKKNFLIHKVDQDGKPLEGAEFEVYGKGKVIEVTDSGDPEEVHVEQ